MLCSVIKFISLLLIYLILFQCNYVNSNKLQPRITNGNEAKPNIAPYIVSLQIQNKHNCAGTIIHKNWILTAAHCITSDQQAKSTVIHAGRHNLDIINEQDMQLRKIDNYKIHKLYIGGIAPYDIALIYVKEPFKWTRKVKSISLPKNSNVIPNGNGILYGWGSISTTNVPKFPNKLQTAIMNLISNDKCENVIKKLNPSLRCHETNMCTMDENKNNFMNFLNTMNSSCKTVCNSDSGGPLVDINGKYLIGIVSWGLSPCGRCNVPSVYVRVSAFIDWIHENMKLK